MSFSIRSPPMSRWTREASLFLPDDHSPSARTICASLITGAMLAVAGCSGNAPEPKPTPTKPGSIVHADPFDVPINGLSSQHEAEFNDGDIAFSTPMREADGLGPLYTRTACDSCHATGVRGPGLVQKMSVVVADRITASPDQSE